MKLLPFLFLLLPLSAKNLPDAVLAAVSSHYAAGGYKHSPADKEPTISATLMGLRTFRYLGVERENVARQREFLLGRFDEKKAAFVETGKTEPDALANAFALMLMGELRMPEDVHAVSARDYVVAEAKSFDEIYLAMAGLQAMGMHKEIPASWVKTMMDTALDEKSTAYDKARAVVTCMRTGFNLPDYAMFLAPLQSALADVMADATFHENPEKLQQAYTLARALVMLDGRCELKLPDLATVYRADVPLTRLYRLAALAQWREELKGCITVAICTGFAPVGYRDESGAIAGMDADVMRAFARENGYDLTFEEVKVFDNIWELPARGSVDAAVSGVSKRQDRLRPGIRWSYPYFNVERSLSILKKNADRFRSIADFDGMKIAVTIGTTGDQDVRERNPNAIRVGYDNEEAAIRDLLAGKVHALARGDVSNQYDARQHSELAVIDAHPMVPVEEFVVAVSAERVALGQKLDKFLSAARRDGRLAEIFAKWLKR